MDCLRSLAFIRTTLPSRTITNSPSSFLFFNQAFTGKQNPALIFSCICLISISLMVCNDFYKITYLQFELLHLSLPDAMILNFCVCRTIVVYRPKIANGCIKHCQSCVVRLHNDGNYIRWDIGPPLLTRVTAFDSLFGCRRPKSKSKVTK